MTRPYLGNPKYTIEVLQKYGFVFQKRFGQNFLIDTRVLDRIIGASEITKDDFVLEIGTRNRNHDPVSCRSGKRGYSSGD